MYQTHPRGLSVLRTAKPSSTHAQHPTAPTPGAVEGSAKSSSLAAALAQRPPGGYSALAGGREEGRDLVAGTANGRARWIDVERGVLKTDLYCRPLSKGQVCGLSLVTYSCCSNH